MEHKMILSNRNAEVSRKKNIIQKKKKTRNPFP